jgi:predicted nuclease of predicted toxin-antitoxin system
MRLLLDMGLPRRAVGDLRAHDIEVDHVGELGMATATDSDILARAQSTGAIVCTLDADFSRLLALSGAAGPSVIHIRIPRVTRIMRQATRSSLQSGGRAILAHHLRCRSEILAYDPWMARCDAQQG